MSRWQQNFLRYCVSIFAIFWNVSGGSAASFVRRDAKNATYDYVIVGGGTAGLTLAARLVLTSNISVAVVEAGGFYQIEQGNSSWVPALFYPSDLGTDPRTPNLPTDWGFISAPQRGLNNRTLHYARGKSLGGSSGRNAMIYQRASRGAYDQWAAVVGDQAYAFDNFARYLMESPLIDTESIANRPANSTPLVDGRYWSPFAGPLHVSWPTWGSPYGTWGMIGMASVGLQENSHLNSGTLQGSAWTPFTINAENAKRDSSETSFFQAVSSNTSLPPGVIRAYTHSMAKKILFDSNKNAVGVLVNNTDSKQTFVLSARNEVILSAGALQSPQLLMVSGIGPEETLKKFNIPVISNLYGVGRNLQDHTIAATSYRVNVVTQSRYYSDPVYSNTANESYNLNHTGILTSPCGPLGFDKITANSSVPLSNTTRAAMAKTFPADWPEVEYVFGDGFPDPNDPGDGYNYGTIFAVLTAPTAVGGVTISSADMNDQPVFNLAMLGNDVDAELILTAFKRVRQIWKGMANITIGEEVVPGPAVKTDAQILDYIRKNAGPFWHASATCAMGRQNDPVAVVDTHAKVFGVNRLRVVDASAFPFLLPGHPQASVYGLAEKIATDITNGR